ncbi:predicted protein [Coccidioides posadasii str. Silveira]|uniref:Predicted protein n=1 Tax=Coccidioides posadasii (strain RMSCC 757 / Silveira) TaxID=443226 RepID=E9CY78_COCPS|nr:predicted protein [Coccidioides posadasii str. Silveira]
MWLRCVSRIGYPRSSCSRYSIPVRCTICRPDLAHLQTWERMHMCRTYFAESQRLDGSRFISSQRHVPLIGTVKSKPCLGLHSLSCRGMEGFWLWLSVHHRGSRMRYYFISVWVG